MLALGLRSLHAAGLDRWPLLGRWRHNVCPGHEWARYGCRRCGKLTDEGYALLR